MAGTEDRLPPIPFGAQVAAARATIEQHAPGISVEPDAISEALIKHAAQALSYSAPRPDIEGALRNIYKLGHADGRVAGARAAYDAIVAGFDRAGEIQQPRVGHGAEGTE